jgi:hypothetical protein
MSDPILQSIEALVTKIDQDEQAFIAALNRRKALVNGLCDEVGAEPRYPDLAESLATPTRAPSSSGTTFTTVRPDQFFGQSLSGSIKRVLEMRKAANLGPAEVRDVYDVLVKGGYAFDTRNPKDAIQGLTVSIGKNSAMFVKLPNGQVGLKEWYPGVRSARGRQRDNGTVEDTGDEGADQQQSLESNSSEQEQK